MNKADIMRQPTVEALLEESIKSKPGITSMKLWEVTKEWHGKVFHAAMGVEFDQALRKLRDTYRCTNKQWYPPRHSAEAKVHGPKKDDPRQVRMDW
jgi:hypothetical protein